MKKNIKNNKFLHDNFWQRTHLQISKAKRLISLVIKCDDVNVNGNIDDYNDDVHVNNNKNKSIVIKVVIKQMIMVLIMYH